LSVVFFQRTIGASDRKNQLKFLIQVTVINADLMFFYVFPLMFVIVMSLLFCQTDTVKVFYSINHQ